jgi:hypothetical protein
VTAVGQAPGGWEALAWDHGSPFHSQTFCQALERHWPGRLHPMHAVVAADGEVTGVAPAYLYEQCPRVDYYRAAGGTLADPLVLSHALVGWYGYPVARSAAALGTVIQVLADKARQVSAVCMFAGIDARDASLIEALSRAGFSIARFHTLMVRPLDPEADRDPLARLRSRYRNARSASLRRARDSGVSCRPATADDRAAAIELMVGVLRRQGIDQDVLPAAYLDATLAADLPGLEMLVAERDGVLIGANVNFAWRRNYSMWLGGYRRELLPQCCQSELLYHASISRAVALGCREIQGGRSPYTPKLGFGFTAVPLLGAVRGSTDAQHGRASVWLEQLALRHVTLYPELRAG